MRRRVYATVLTGFVVFALIVGCSDDEPVADDSPTSTAGVNPAPTDVNPFVPTPATPLPTLGTDTQSKDAIPAGWQRYVDPVLAFLLHHPPGLSATTRYSDLQGAEGQSPVQVRTLTYSDAKGVPAFSVFVAPNSGGLTAEQWNEAHPGCCFGKPQAVSVGGEEGLLFPEGALDSNPRVLVQHEGYIFGLAGYVKVIPDSPPSPILTEGDFKTMVEGFEFAS